MQFISTTQVAEWQKPKDDSVFKNDRIGTYSISDKTITITDTGSDDSVGIIENSKINLLVDGINLIFIKQ